MRDKPSLYVVKLLADLPGVIDELDRTDLELWTGRDVVILTELTRNFRLLNTATLVLVLQEVKQKRPSVIGQPEEIELLFLNIDTALQCALQFTLDMNIRPVSRAWLTVEHLELVEEAFTQTHTIEYRAVVVVAVFR